MADTIKKYKVDVDTTSAVEDVNQLNAALGKTDNEIKKVATDSGKIKDGVDKVSRGFGGFVKALGIVGLLVTVFDLLVETLKQNEKVMKFVQIAMDTINSVFNAVVDTISAVYTKVMDLTNGFDSTKKVIGGLITLAITPLKLEFYAIMLAVKKAQLAWEESFFGKGRVDKINELNADITGIKNNITQVALEAKQSAKDIYNNVGGMVKDFKVLGNAIIDESGKAVKNFKVTSQNTIKEATTSVVSGFDKLKSEIDRINKEIENAAFKGDIKMVEQLKLQLGSLQVEYQKVLNLINKPLDVSPEIKSKLKFIVPVANGEVEEIGETEEEKKARLDKDTENEKKRLEQIANIKTSINEQGKIDDQEKLVEDKLIWDAKVQLAQDGMKAIGEISSFWSDLQFRKQEKLLKDGKISQEQYEKNIYEIKKKAAIRDKAIAISGAIMGTGMAIINALNTKPVTWANPALAVSAGVMGALQIAKIIATPVESMGGGGGGAGGGGSTPTSTEGTAPNTSFSFSPNTKPTETQPIKTYVISKEVETQQQLDRSIIQNGTI